MGCDIHPYVCYRTGEGRLKSFQHDPFSLGRDYTLFGLLAGVRGTHALFEARGFPEEVPFHINLAFDRRADDTHDASWLTTAEVKAVDAAYAQIREEEGGPKPRNMYMAALIGCMQGLDDWCAVYDPGGYAVLVFYFDC